jgi:hypothetical protein
MLKRPLEEAVAAPDPKRTAHDDDSLAHVENLTLFAGVVVNSPDKKKGVTKADFTDRPPRVEPIKRPEDDRTQTLSGFCLTDGDDSYIIPLDLVRKWTPYDVGARRIYCPIPLLKTAVAMSLEHDEELSRGVSNKDTVYSPEQIEVLRTAFMTEEGRAMCKDERPKDSLFITKDDWDTCVIDK